MGLSIHYNGQLKDCQKVYKLRKELVDISNEMGWEYTLIEKNEDDGDSVPPIYGLLLPRPRGVKC